MLTIAIASTKGGVGKTTTAASLGVRAAQDSARVALVDLDPQRALIEWWHRRGGKSAAEINKGRDKVAASEIDALWLGVKAAATKAAKARRKDAVHG